jgi:hypothetical protein
VWKICDDDLGSYITSPGGSSAGQGRVGEEEEATGDEPIPILSLDDSASNAPRFGTAGNFASNGRKENPRFALPGFYETNQAFSQSSSSGGDLDVILADRIRSTPSTASVTL